MSRTFRGSGRSAIVVRPGCRVREKQRRGGYHTDNSHPVELVQKPAGGPAGSDPIDSAAISAVCGREFTASSALAVDRDGAILCAGVTNGVSVPADGGVAGCGWGSAGASGSDGTSVRMSADISGRRRGDVAAGDSATNKRRLACTALVGHVARDGRLLGLVARLGASAGDGPLAYIACFVEPDVAGFVPGIRNGGIDAD